MGWPDTQPLSHAWGPVRWRQFLAASQGIAAFSACCLPQMSHMLLRLFERCEPDHSTCFGNSDSNSPASSQGLLHTLHWPPKLRTLHYCRCTALWGNYHNSDDNFPASSRGSADTLRWLPNLGRTDSHRSTSTEVAEVQGDLASASLRIQVGAYRSGRISLCKWHNWN